MRGMALATDFNLSDSTYGGSLWWAEPDANGDHEWKLSPLGKITTSHRLRWANLDGKGRVGLVDAPLLGYGAVAPEYKVPAPLTWFEIPEAIVHGHGVATEIPPAMWQSHLIDDSLTVTA